MAKLKAATELHLRAYQIVQDAVERGVAYGWTRAHKHADAPSEDSVRSCMERAVMDALCEVIDWRDEE